MSQIDIEIEKLVYGGDGLARANGRTVLVPFTLPGEKLTADVVREKGRLVRGRPSAFAEQSTERVEPPCPVFGACGGCNYQHIPYERQLEYKEAILRETLARIGKIEWDGPVERIASDPWGYRNRTQIRVAKNGPRVEVGFLEAGSHTLVPTDACPINSPKLNQVHAAIKGMAGERRFPNFLREIEFFTNESDVQLNVVSSERPLAKEFFEWAAEHIDGLLPGAHIDYPCKDDVFRVGSRSFFQVNRFLVDRLAAAAIDGGSGATALDLYCGVGLVTLPLARRFENVAGVDSSAAATRSLQFNAERAGLNIKAIHLNVNQFLAGFSESVDLIVADPPRAGLGEDVVRELLRIAAPQLHIVSCDPSTLARDLKTLLQGGYQIDSLTLVDLFPQTYHLETVVRLKRQADTRVVGGHTSRNCHAARNPAPAASLPIKESYVKITKIIAGALVASLSVATTPLLGAEHLVPAAEVRQQLTEREQTRSQNVSALTKFFQAPAARQAFAKAGMDTNEVVGAVASLDDEALAGLASRATDALNALSAGALNNQQLTYIIIALGTAVLILVILAA